MPALGLDQPADIPAPRLRPPGEPDVDWLARHRGFIGRARQGDIDLYLEGDSLTDLWSQSFKPHFNQTFSRWKTASFAISGDRTEHVLWRITNGQLAGFSPRTIMLTIGTNNLPSLQGIYAARQPEEVAAGVRAILQVFAEKFPQARILLVGPPPREDRLNAQPPALREDLNPKLRQLNALLAQIAHGSDNHVKYLDFFEAYLDTEKKIKPGMLFDRLHPDLAGYEIWANAILPTLTEWLA